MLTPARWIAGESLFLPPVRNVHFDSSITTDPEEIFLLSLASVYNLSAEEALKKCEEFVAEFHKMLVTEGTVDFGSIGVFMLEDDAEITMASCECGVSTPTYYGLDALHIKKLQFDANNELVKSVVTVEKIIADTQQDSKGRKGIANSQANTAETSDKGNSDNKAEGSHAESNESKVIEVESKTIVPATQVDATQKPIGRNTEKAKDDKSITIRISRNFVNYVFAVAATIAVIFILKPSQIDIKQRGKESARAGMYLQPNMINHAEKQNDYILEDGYAEEDSIFDAVLVDITDDALNEGFDFDNAETALQENTPNNVEAIASTSIPEIKETAKADMPVATPAPAAATPQASSTTNGKFCIVLASSISKVNAQSFVERLKKDNINATILEKGKMRRVVIDGFNTQNEAYQYLNPIKNKNSELSSAWVMAL